MLLTAIRRELTAVEYRYVPLVDRILDTIHRNHQDERLFSAVYKDYAALFNATPEPKGSKKIGLFDYFALPPEKRNELHSWVNRYKHSNLPNPEHFNRAMQEVGFSMKLNTESPVDVYTHFALGINDKWGVYERHKKNRTQEDYISSSSESGNKDSMYALQVNLDVITEVRCILGREYSRQNAEAANMHDVAQSSTPVDEVYNILDNATGNTPEGRTKKLELFDKYIDTAKAYLESYCKVVKIRPADLRFHERDM